MREVVPLGLVVWRPPGSGPAPHAPLPLLPPAVAPPPALWPHQVTAVDRVLAAWAAGHRSVLLAAPTGSGKTVTARALIEIECAQGGRVLFMAPRRELVEQLVAKLRAVGIQPGVLMAGDTADGLGLAAPVQVASVDTVGARRLRPSRRRIDLPTPPTLVIVDEAHLGVTDRMRRLLAHWPDARRLGLTATPCRKDGRALGLFYDVLVETATTASLTPEFLVPARYWSWATPDLGGVRLVAKDYEPGALEQRMNQPRLVGDVVEHWLRLAGDRRTVVFASGVAHAIALAAAFRGAGVAAEYVDAYTPTSERRATFDRFRSGATQVLTNCFLAAYGFDLPALSAVVLARPTRSLMLFLQMLGRGLRIAPETGKTDCLVLDHAGCVHRHGFAADDRVWTLDGTTALVPPSRGAREPAAAKECPVCHAVFTGTATCPECAFEFKPKGRLVETLDGALVEIGVGADATVQDRMQFYLELRAFAAERGWKIGAAAHKFEERYGVMPPWAWNTLPLVEPSLATRRWLKSRAIAWWRSRQNTPSDGARA
jgi:superfamily II DNA or RNA helicase